MAEVQSMTDAVCHLKGLKQVLHMMEDDRSELEAGDNVCTCTGDCVRLRNPCVQSEIHILLTHTLVFSPQSFLESNVFIRPSLLTQTN